MTISFISKSPLHDPTLNCSEGYLFGKNTLSFSSKANFPPDCVNKCTAGVQPPATPKQSQEIFILLPVTDKPSLDNFITETLFNLL